MLRRLSQLFVLASLPLLVVTSCSSPSADDGTEFSEQAATAEDLALAKQMIALLNGPTGKCNGCHSASPDRIRAWGTRMAAVDAACFTAQLTPKQRIDCLRNDPANPASGFSAGKLGLYAAGAHLPQFDSAFRAAFPAAQAQTLYTGFRQSAGMPRRGAFLTAAEFARLKGWVVRGMPQFDEALRRAPDGGAPDGGDAGRDAEAGPAAACTESTTPALRTHLTEMRTTGWGARLADLATPMLGCGGAASPLACLTSFPAITSISRPGLSQTVRKLREQPLVSQYWVRSSADGRYVGFGLNDSTHTSLIVDLSKPASASPIVVAADYDPAFLPSNDGFAFAGARSDDAIHMCRQSLLADAAALPTPSISLTEAKCTSIAAQVYQSIGTSLDGAKYFLTFGAHENDNGGNQITSPLPAAFGAAATTTFVPMVNDGAAYRARASVVLKTPGEGDAMLSPSTKLVAYRFQGGGKQAGYRVRAVSSNDVGANVTVETPLRAEVCMKGAKASFSFDERFMVTHQYVDPTEADNVGLPSKSSNIVLADLLTGTKVRLTTMPAGQYALYPHFRADGWLYFLVRDMNKQIEYVAATDAALRMPLP